MDPAAETPGEGRTSPLTARSTVWLLLCRKAVLVALAASAALYLQYLMPAEAAFCGLESGCEAVRRAGFSYFFDSPLLSIPLVGLIAYGAVMAASLFAPETRLTLWLTALGAVGAIGLLMVQAFVVHAFCWLCAAVDVSAVFAAIFAFMHDRASYGRTSSMTDPLARWAWLALGAAAVLSPAGWVRARPAPPVPPSILAFYEPGKINVVEFADFECPYCRRLHPVLKRVLHDYPAERVHFVRGHVPLPSHDDARPAARAAVCAEAQGLGEKLADKLVTIELSPSATRRAAVEIGVDPARFDQCLASTEPDRRIDRDTRALEQAGMQGLPTTYVQGKRLLGAVSEAALRDALDRARRGGAEAGIPAPIYITLVMAVLVGIAWLGRSSRGKLRHERTS
jgi:uncharacterized membrane protein/thiol-disulfide isomerase/thioredoxin